MKKYISIISMFFACFMGVANAVPMNAQIADLIQQKADKIAKLEECEGKKKGWMIAGISTIGVTAVGVAGNIVLANKSKELTIDIEAAKQKSKQGTGGAGGSGVKLMDVIGVTEIGKEQSFNNETMTFSVDYHGDKGSITGKAQCSTQGVENKYYYNDNKFEADHFVETLPDSVGQYCWCQLTGYTSAGGVVQTLSAPWVFESELSSDTYCAHTCAEDCAYDLYQADSDTLAFREAMFNSVK